MIISEVFDFHFLSSFDLPEALCSRSLFVSRSLRVGGPSFLGLSDISFRVFELLSVYSFHVGGPALADFFSSIYI